MINPFDIVYNPEASSAEFKQALEIIANPALTWPIPYQQWVQAFLQQDTQMREWLDINFDDVPLLEAPNPWHMPATIRAQEDVYERFVEYTDHMRRLHGPEP